MKFKKREYIYLGVVIILVITAGFQGNSFASGDLPFSVIVERDLEFDIEKPVKGSYLNDENKSGLVTINANIPVNVTFKSSLLELDNDNRRNDNPTLDISYFIEDISHNTLISKTLISDNNVSYNLNNDCDNNYFRQFKITGEIQISSLSSQPAGQYKGEIIVTVTAQD